MDYDYPILKRVFEHYRKAPHDVGNFYLVGCQHLMEPQKKMFERLIEFGFDPKKIFMLGKIYSTNQEVLRELNSMGITAIQPEFSGLSFDEEHKNNCKKLFAMIPDGAQSILLDDGAELIKTFAEDGKKVIFGVEQTSSGFRRLEKEEIPFPVLNVARSVTKLTQEAPLVARHLCERIQNYLHGKQVLNPKILIVGLGPIGESIFQVFKESGLDVEGFDIKHGHNNLLAKIQELKPDAVIGATGVQILTTEEIETLSSGHKLFLISASSSDREFPVVSYRSNEAAHDNVTFKNIVFVNNGFPFSFMSNRYEMTPIEIEKTMCLLGGAVMYGTQQRNKLNTGLIDVPEELEKLINGST